MIKRVTLGAAALLLLSPSLALAAGPQALELSAKAQIDGATVPLGVTVSTENTDVVLSPVNKDGATPVTVTLYIVPKPKPVVATSSAAAAVESSQGIQNSIKQVSPQTESYVAPVFSFLDGARSAAADVLDTQLSSTKTRLGPNPGNVGEVLGSETAKNAAKNPLAVLLLILNTLYFYLLTIVRFIIGSAGVFYPVVAIAFLFFLWRMFRRFRRPAY